MKENEIVPDKLKALLNMAKWGWWKADFHDKTYTCSNFIIDLLDLKSDILPFYDFKEFIREDYQARITNEFAFILAQDVYEQTFPIHTKYGVRWVHSQMGLKEKDEKGHLIAWGFLQCIEDQEKDTNRKALNKVNHLLYQQNSISRSLLTFLQTEEISSVILKILHDIQEQFNGGRVYIIEYDTKNMTQYCLYEVLNDQSLQNQQANLPLRIDETPWKNRQLMNSIPIILSNLDEIPQQGLKEKTRWEAQHIKSMMAVPMLSKDGVWGYLGINIMKEYRSWSNEDYQWFASMGNIISICIQLHNSEQIAHKEREYFENLYQYMPIGYIRMKLISDGEGTPVDYVYLDANPAFEEITGRDRHHIIGKNASSLNFPITPGPSLKEITDILSVKNYYEANYSLNNGNKYCRSIIYSPGKDEIVALFSDITETVKAHEALDRSEKMLRNIYKNIPVGIEIYDKNGIAIDINNKGLEIFGLTRKEDLLGVNFLDNPNFSEEIKAQVQAKQEVNYVVRYDFSKINVHQYYKTSYRDTIKDLLIKITPLYDNNNHFQNYLFIIIDNTEILTAHNKIKEFENFFSIIADYAKIGYCRWNQEQQKGFAISQWFKNWGASEDSQFENIIGIYPNVHPEDRPEIKKLYQDLLKGKINRMHKEVRVKDENGQWKWIRSDIASRPLENNRYLELTGINFDITEMKEIEAKLTEAKIKAETLDKLKSAFLANMSHEIRTPLNAIVGFSNLLLEASEQAEKQQYINIIQENTELLLQLISDILDLSKIEAGTFEFVNGDVDVNLMCQEIIRAARLKTPENIQLIFGDHQPECRLFSDKNRLNQVIFNFINNAIKFTSKGSITLGYRLAHGQIEFYVQDTGIGIDQEHVHSIFDRFVKLNTFVHGTGLGLAICKSIVEQMGGTIGVDSVKGAGSRFWFAIPYVFSQTSEPEVLLANTTIQEKSLNKSTILIAEDTDSNYILISTILKKEYTVVRAFNGSEAIKMVEEVHPDLVLMDIKMPEMDGLTATQQIRKKHIQVPIIALTAFAYDKDRIKALEAGCNEYITKPIQAPLLKEMIKRFI
ncbi:response regulator [uncultured Sanguibacteroides sp.]|uniref:response regulator n=1 Tax=uncultured Sanguibacteroides sp. TaxID=1635151 RepID=UPI0025FC66DB|nr:response regulator [uncultured Sanguibacteroides sp.]